MVLQKFPLQRIRQQREETAQKTTLIWSSVSLSLFQPHTVHWEQLDHYSYGLQHADLLSVPLSDTRETSER
jgi:hypothetical protein